MGAKRPYTPAERTIISTMAAAGHTPPEIVAAMNEAKAGPARRAKTIRSSDLYRLSRPVVAAPVQAEPIEASPIQPDGTYRCPHFPNDRINLPVVKGYVGEQAHG